MGATADYTDFKVESTLVLNKNFETCSLYVDGKKYDEALSLMIKVWQNSQKVLNFQI
jgi:hypothetical protein